MSIYRNQQWKNEREAFEQAYEQKQRVPYDSVAAENFRLQTQIAEQEHGVKVNGLKHKLVSEPSPDFSAPIYQGDDKPDVVETKCRAAFEAFKEQLRSEWGLELSKEDARLVGKFLAANNPRFDLTQISTFQLAWQYIVARLQTLDDEFGKSQPKPDIAEKETAPVLSEEQKHDPFVDGSINPYRGGTREADKWDAAKHKFEASREIGEIVAPWIQEICDQSRMVLPEAGLRFFLDKVLHSRTLLNRDAIRMLFFRWYHAEVGAGVMTDSERRAIDLEFDTSSADQFALKYTGSVPRNNAPHGGQLSRHVEW